MKRRPVLFASAAAVTLWSAWIVIQRPADGASLGVVPPQRPARPAVDRPAALQATREDAAASAADLRPRVVADPSHDAFAAREWVKPLPPPPPPREASPPPAPPPAPAAPPAPTLPYRFVGLMDQGRAAPAKVFLSLGDKLLVASVGDTLEGGWRLAAVTPNELVFNNVQTNLPLRLSVTAGNP